MVVAVRNPQDSMAATWLKDPSKQTWRHKFLSWVGDWSDNDKQKFPVFQKTDPIPYGSQWSVNRWVLTHALWPIAIQAIYKYFTGTNISPLAAVFLYVVAFNVNSLHQVKVLHNIAKRIGYLDGDKHARDEVPDVGVNKVLDSFALTMVSRSIFTVFLGYRRDAPISFSWWLPVELVFYSIVLDFFFYTYHRACHEIPGLWQYHRTHHLTKHPNPLLSAYSDREQEAIEMVIVPLLTYFTLRAFGFPMGFYDWWICHQYIIYAEAFGHTGLRLAASTPGPSGWLLSFVNCELFIEDHDLHHRNGWRKSANYGKQTLLWDRLFGTAGTRIESQFSNIDYNNPIDMPWY